MGRLRSLASRLAPPPLRLRAPPKVADRFYQSKEWRSLVARLKRQRGAFCQRCGSTDRIIADHIVERKDGGDDLNPGNIELLCFTHHQRKTAEARAKRAGRGR